MQWQKPVEIGPGVGFEICLDAQRRLWWRLAILSPLQEMTIYSEEKILSTGVVDAFVGDVPIVNTFGVYITYDDGSVCIPARAADGGVYFCTPIEEV